MKREYLNLNTGDCGFAVKTNGRHIKENGVIRLFDTINIANQYMTNTLRIRNRNLYQIMVQIHEGFLVRLEDCYHKYDCYIYEDEATDTEWIMQENLEMVSMLNAGYLVFEEGDTRRYRWTEIAEKQKDIHAILLDLLYWMPDRLFVYNVSSTHGIHWYCTFKDTSVQCHICSNEYLMEWNQRRKKDNDRCIPYISSMDKYMTLYLFFTKPRKEHTKENAIRAEELRSIFFDLLNRDAKQYSPMYTPISRIKGYVNISEYEY